MALTHATGARLSSALAGSAAARKQLADAMDGPQWVAGVGIASVREPITEDVARRYERATATIGMRWPLLGSRDALQRNRLQAQLGSTQAEIQQRAARQEVQRQVRAAVVTAYWARLRQEAAERFLASRGQVEAQLEERRRAGRILGAEAADMVSQIDSVAQEREHHRSQRLAAEDLLSALTGQPGGFRLSAVQWPSTCFADARLEARTPGTDEALATAELEAAQAAQASGGTGIWSVAEAGVQISHSQSRDLPGLGGHNTGASVDLRIPFHWKAAASARRAETAAAVEAASARAAAARQAQTMALTKALRSLQLAQTQQQQLLRARAASAENVRVQGLRLNEFDGDGYSRLLGARHADYRRGIDILDNGEKTQLAQIELLALAGPCDPIEGDVAEAAWAQVTAPPADAAAAPSPRPPQQVPARDVPGGFGWFVWNGQAFLQRPQLLDTLPPRTTRLLLSFTGEQLAALDRKAWQAVYARAHEKGMRVELLVGAPEVATDRGRDAMVAQLRSLVDLPVDGLNLDVERSQLPGEVSAATWKPQVLKGMEAIHKATKWPLALTTHHRDLDDAQFLDRLRGVGVHEVVAMIYSTSAQRTQDVAMRLLRASTGMKVSVAQSIERELKTTESSFKLGRSRSLERWQTLDKTLKAQPFYGGLVIQSWSEFQQAEP